MGGLALPAALRVLRIRARTLREGGLVAELQAHGTAGFVQRLHAHGRGHQDVAVFVGVNDGVCVDVAVFGGVREGVTVNVGVEVDVAGNEDVADGV